MQLVGLDLGQTSDPSALCVFTRKDVPAAPLSELPAKPEKHGPPAPPKIDWEDIGAAERRAEEHRQWKRNNPHVSGDASFDDGEELAQAPKVITERQYLCRAMRKYPLGTSYVRVVEDVRRLCASPMLNVDGDGNVRPPTLIVDATGLGAPVVDMFRAAKVPAHLIAITITGGNATRVDKDRPWHHFVPKHILVNSLQVLLQTGRTHFPRGLVDPLTGEDMEKALMQELRDYRVKITKALNESFDAEPGTHDDVLMAVSYVSWFGERGGRTPKVW